MDGELHLVALADLQCPPDLVKAGYVAKEKDGRSRHLKTGRGEPLTEVQLTLPGALRSSMASASGLVDTGYPLGATRGAVL